MFICYNLKGSKWKGNKYLICKIWRVTYNFNKLVFQHIFIHAFFNCQKFHLDVETWQDSILQRKPELFVLHFLLHELHSTRIRVSLDIFFCVCAWWSLLPPQNHGDGCFFLFFCNHTILMFCMHGVEIKVWVPIKN